MSEMSDDETIKDIVTWQIEFSRRDKCTNADAANRIIVELDRRGYMVIPKQVMIDLVRAEEAGDFIEVFTAYRGVRRAVQKMKAAANG